jgi:hypothetical protein
MAAQPLGRRQVLRKFNACAFCARIRLGFRRVRHRARSTTGQVEWTRLQSGDATPSSAAHAVFEIERGFLTSARHRSFRRLLEFVSGQRTVVATSQSVVRLPSHRL